MSACEKCKADSYGAHLCAPCEARKEADALRARAERAEAALAEYDCDHGCGCGKRHCAPGDACAACALTSQRDAARTEVRRLQERIAEMDWPEDVARRQREACAATMAKCSSVWGDMVRATPLVTDQEEP